MNKLVEIKLETFYLKHCEANRTNKKKFKIVADFAPNFEMYNYFENRF